MATKRVLLSEGSSPAARQIVTALGLAGYIVDVCDATPLCLARSSRFVRRVYRCPPFASDPRGYLRFILHRLAVGAYDVLLPSHEQAYLFARVRAELSRRVGLAVPSFEAMRQIQSKSTFVRLLEELAIPQPRTCCVTSEAELASRRDFPFFLKSEYGTATTGVWRITSAADLHSALATLQSRGGLNSHSPVLVQDLAPGTVERVQAVFDAGRLIAWHGYRQQQEGLGGGDSAKISVLRLETRDHVARLGARLDWHGALSLDYLFDERNGRIAFIDGNPRLIEPMNACLSGINLPDILARISLGQRLDPLPPGRQGVRTHAGVMTLLASAARTGSRVDLLRLVVQEILGRGSFHDSREELTSLPLDPLSGITFATILVRLMLNPRRADSIAAKAVGSYSLTPESARAIAHPDWTRGLFD